MAGGYQGAIPNMRVMIAVAPALKRTLRARERERVCMEARWIRK